MYKFLGLYLLIIIGLFIEFSFLGTFGNTVIKILILSSVSYFLYEIWRDQSANNEKENERESIEAEPIHSDEEGSEEASQLPIEETKSRTTLPKVFEIEQISLSGLYQGNEIFREFIINQFSLIWDFIYPKNGYIIYTNEEESSRILYKNTQSQIHLENDHHPQALLTLIDNKEGILIENNIDQTLHLIPFYQNDEYSPKSLLGFVSKFESGEKLYWVFDSDLKDTFNLEDLKILERINENSKSMIHEAIQNTGLNLFRQTLLRKLEISNNFNKVSSVEDCLDSFCDFMVEDFEATKLTIALRKNYDLTSDTAFIFRSVGGGDPYETGFEFPLDQGLNGWVITKNKPHLIENIEKGEYFVPRFSENEKSNYGIKSFLSVPIAYSETAIGMVTIEDQHSGKYTNKDKRNLIEYSELLANALSRFKNIEITK